MDILELAKEKREITISDTEELNKRAECGFNLTKTVEYIEGRLKKIGYSPKRIGKCSILAEINGGFDTTTLLRADTDAISYKDGAKHLCGHHIHTSTLLTAAEIIYENRNKLCKNIKLLFQGAEETLEGAYDCINAGVLNNPKVNEAFMIHVLPALPIETGTVIVSSAGVSAPGAVFFDINIKGRSSHGSSPQNGIDALIVGANIATALENLTAREFVGSDAILTLGKFQSGTAANIIADSALISGTMRTASKDDLESLVKRAAEMAENIAKGYQASGSLEIKSSCPPLCNDKNASEFAYKAISEIKGIRVIYSKELTDDSGKKSLGGSEDFSYFAEKIPSTMIGVASGDSRKGYEYPLHHPDVKFDREALPICASVYAALAIQK